MTNNIMPNEWISLLVADSFDQISTLGKSVKTKDCTASGKYPVVDQGKGLITGYVDDFSNVVEIENPIVLFGDHTRAVKWIDFNFVPGADGTKLLKPKFFINNRFSYYQLKSLDIPDKGYSRHFKYLKELSFLIPPLAEQQVIADKLDILLTQVESIKVRLERIPEILKQLRQSVLAAAVSGKMTEKWRRINTNHVRQDIYSIDKYWENEYKKNNKKYKKIEYAKSDFDLSAFPDSWIKTNVGRVFDVYVGATPSRQREDFWNGEINWVSSSEVAFCRIQSTKENITDEGYKSTSTTIHPIGTVMLAMIGQGKTRGQAAILDMEACHNQNTAALRVPEKIAKSEFLYFYLMYKYEETRQVGSGNNQQAMNKAIVQRLEFPLPPFEEQIEIVNKIESFFEYIEIVEIQIQVALDRVNSLTQSILAKAFRGELTAKWRKANPDLISGEKSAEALLDRIKIERSAKPSTTRSRGKA